MLQIKRDTSVTILLGGAWYHRRLLLSRGRMVVYRKRCLLFHPFPFHLLCLMIVVVLQMLMFRGKKWYKKRKMLVLRMGKSYESTQGKGKRRCKKDNRVKMKCHLRLPIKRSLPLLSLKQVLLLLLVFIIQIRLLMI